MLRQISKVCEEQLREVDILARFGGEEFAVLMPNTDVAGARLTAERLRQAVEQNVVQLSKGNYRVTTSIGVSGLRAADKGVVDVLKRADDALYQAKRAGRNRVVVEPFVMGVTPAPPGT